MDDKRLIVKSEAFGTPENLFRVEGIYDYKKKFIKI
jgi:hypothetical protein